LLTAEEKLRKAEIQLNTRKNPVDFALIVWRSAELAVSGPGSR
jgi:hypothetical protein